MGYEHVIPQFIGRLTELSKQSTVRPHVAQPPLLLRPAGKASRGRPLPFPIQGSGTQTRSFIYIDDFTAGLMLVIDTGEHLGIYHIGTMDEISIADTARAIGKEMGTELTLVPGPEAPGAAVRRCPDITKLRSLGFQPRFTLSRGLKPTVGWYLAHPAPDQGTLTEPPLFFLS
jgi:nucleoside-diphosphate-sugar epimerase